MDLIDLILTVCLITNPQNCHDEHLYFEQRGGGVNKCMMLAQPEIVKWMAEHPKFKVVRWKCAPPDKATSI